MPRSIARQSATGLHLPQGVERAHVVGHTDDPEDAEPPTIPGRELVAGALVEVIRESVGRATSRAY
jgi:hypothetical protein